MGSPRIGSSHFASGLDIQLAGARYVGCLENISVPAAELIEAGLHAAARSGPYTRVGLLPNSGARRWTFESRLSPAIRALPREVADTGSAAVVQYIRRQSAVRRPFEVHVSDRHIAVDVDHGLGDARLFVDFVHALFTMRDGRNPRWIAEPDTRFALSRALVRTFAVHPSRVASASRRALMSRTGTAHAEIATDPMPWSPSVAVEDLHLGAEYGQAVDRWREANAPKVGRAATWLMIVRRALAATGVDIADTVRLVIDCRRYLPRGRRVNDNFIFGLKVLAPADKALTDVGREIKEQVASGFPVLAMGLVSARSLAWPAPQSPGVPCVWRPGSPADMVYSDVGPLTPFDDGPWRPNEPKVVSALLDPASPSHVSVFTGMIGGERTISFTFHDNVYDRNSIRKAVDAIRSDPIGFLELR
ncbi:hypothetical protein [Mycobacterium sp. 852013-50091_SCH5140682]|uniref:hypothetical protein n=1 Tax=Mycobacterium sp. 852013-50091_SCH5140682 TaxID=1834109 RepID=UPI000B23659A|nr:hypothetical protein [Mycobacterium sp. 852013-50091_SCH5140682]